MYYSIFLDDCRDTCCENTIVCRNYLDFTQIITEKGLPTSISFDYDLDDIKNGKDCVEWLINYCIKNKRPLPECCVHSSNPVGKEEIYSVINTFNKHFVFTKK